MRIAERSCHLPHTVLFAPDRGKFAHTFAGGGRMAEPVRAERHGAVPGNWKHAKGSGIELAPELAADVLPRTRHQRIHTERQTTEVMEEFDVLGEERCVFAELGGIAALVE